MSARSEPYSLVVKRRLVTPQVERARDALISALGEAVDRSGLTRDEAEGRLSLFIGFLWDDLTLFVKQLPGMKIGSAPEDSASNQAAELAALHRERGLSYRAIAEKLNSEGHTTRRGSRFYAATIKNLLERKDDERRPSL